MKNIITSFFIILLCVFSCKHRAHIQITGSLDSAEGTTVKVESTDYKVTYDSIIVNNKKFILNTSLPKDGFYELTFYTKTKDFGIVVNHSLFYAENQKTYNFYAPGLNNLSYNDKWQSSSYQQVKLNEFKHLTNLIRDTLRYKRQLILDKADKALTLNDNKNYNLYLDSVGKADDAIKQAYLYATHQFVRVNPNSITTPYLITQVYDIFENYTLYRSALNKLTPQIKRSDYYDEANELLKSSQNLYIGAHTPRLYNKDAKEFKLNYQGKKIVLIDFWASYCLPCRQQMPDMKVLYNKYKTKGFDIVSVSIDEDPIKWGRASRQEGIPWHNIAELTDQSKSKNIRNFVVKSIPANYVLNGKGELIGRNIGLDSLERMLTRLK